MIAPERPINKLETSSSYILIDINNHHGITFIVTIRFSRFKLSQLDYSHQLIIGRFSEKYFILRKSRTFFPDSAIFCALPVIYTFTYSL